MRHTTATILTSDPIVTPIAQMGLMSEGLHDMMDWVRSRAPECVPEEYDHDGRIVALFPHEGLEGLRELTSNELLVELAGRKCYNSFGLKAGRKSNAEYIANTQAGDVPHASIMYHAKMSFFIAGVSRRVSHELIRHYVGADRDEEGAPSQESTRYVEHAGFYVAHPRDLKSPTSLKTFEVEAKQNYECYLQYIDGELRNHLLGHGFEPQGMDRKRIYESASSRLLHSIETSFIWTSNPIALAKMFRERDNEFADLEYQRFAKIWKQVCLKTWPNLWPQAWMQKA